MVRGSQGWSGGFGGGPGVSGVVGGLDRPQGGGGRLQVGPGGLRPQLARPVAPGHDGRLRPARNTSSGLGRHATRVAASGCARRLCAARYACRGLKPRREALRGARRIPQPQATTGGSARRATRLAASGYDRRLRAARNASRGLRPLWETPGSVRRVPELPVAA